jgi:hypothetical protein
MSERKLTVEKETKPNIELLPEKTINSISLDIVYLTFTLHDRRPVALQVCGF